MSARNLDVLWGLGLIVLAAVFYSQTLGAFAETRLARNPMAIPRLLQGLLAFGGVMLMARAFIRSRGTNDLPGAEMAPGLNWSGIVLVLVLVLAYLLGFARIGFIPATAIFFPVTCFVLGYRNMVVTGLVTILAIVLIWYLFTRGFSIRPPGIGFDDLWRMLAGTD